MHAGSGQSKELEHIYITHLICISSYQKSKSSYKLKVNGEKTLDADTDYKRIMTKGVSEGKSLPSKPQPLIKERDRCC